MRKKSMRLVSVALAACMMMSVLPVGAFALDVGAAPESSVSTQAEVYHLVGGETISDDFIARNGSSYSMNNAYTESGEYTKNVIIDTTKNVRIEVAGDINYNVINSSLWHVKNVNDLTIKNNGHTVQVDSTRYIQILREEYNAQVGKIAVDWGTYKGGTDSAFQFSSGGKADLKNVTIEGNSNNAIYANGSCEITIKDGSSFTCAESIVISQRGGTCNIYGGEYIGSDIVLLVGGTGQMNINDAKVSGGVAINAWQGGKVTITDCIIKGSKWGIWVENDNVILNSAAFEAKNDESDIYLAAGKTITIADTFMDTATVKVADDPIITPRQITTEDTEDYQSKWKLVSADDTYIVDYMKDETTGKEYRYLGTRDVNSHIVAAGNATATAILEDAEKQLYSFTQVPADTEVTLTADAPDEGWVFAGWQVSKGGVTLADEPVTTFNMPADSDVVVSAQYEYMGTDIGDGGAGGAIAAVVVGAAATWGVYEAGTGIYRMMNMRGIPLPSNRAELAMLIWERAGKPEPASTALYDDIDADNADLQKAAHWMVEQDLMDEKADNTFKPNTHVTKLRVCTTWEKAKQKGLFDKTEE